jgi:DNA polymerase-3 subunit epsilon
VFIDGLCTVLDTLVLARQMHPGQKNSLDALCKRYGIDNSAREHHGALLDAEILAEVYLAMTGGQVHLSLEGRGQDTLSQSVAERRPVAAQRAALKVISASAAELDAHERRLQAIEQASAGRCLWLHEQQDGPSN